MTLYADETLLVVPAMHEHALPNRISTDGHDTYGRSQQRSHPTKTTEPLYRIPQSITSIVRRNDRTSEVC